MTTQSFPSQTFGAKPLMLADLFQRLLSGWFVSRHPLPADDRVNEANRVRSYADSVHSHDPRFAADLRAAADRHERSSH